MENGQREDERMEPMDLRFDSSFGISIIKMQVDIVCTINVEPMHLYHHLFRRAKTHRRMPNEMNKRKVETVNSFNVDMNIFNLIVHI